MNRIVRALANVGGWMGQVIIAAMAVLVFVDVVGTKFFGRPVAGTVEIIEELLAVLVILGLGLTQLERGHLRVSLIGDRLSQRWRDMLDLVTCYLVGTVVSAFFCWRSFVLVQKTIDIGTVKGGIILLPIWPTAVGVLIGSLIFVVCLLSLTINMIKKLRLYKSSNEVTSAK